jgi:hypothetical protein
MKKYLPTKTFCRRLALFLSLAAFLFSAILALILRCPESIGEFQVRLPCPPYLGNPGEILLEVHSWRRPQQKLLLAGLPSGMDFLSVQPRLAGVSGKGFRWQISCLFWAVEFTEYESLTASYGQLKETIPLHLQIMPRQDLSGIDMPPPAAIPASRLSLLVYFLAALFVLADLLLQAASRQQAQRRALRQLKTLPANTEGCAALWRVWRQFTLPTAQSCWLGAEIRKMQFAPDGLNRERFALCRELLIGECRKSGRK